jgi:PBP1b-binding outer membrane lipoprotein LpoB
MIKRISKSTLFTIMAFASLNVMMVVGCSEKTETTTEKTETTTETAAPAAEAAPAAAVESAPAAAAPAAAAAAPKDSMGTAETRPVDPAIKT